MPTRAFTLLELILVVAIMATLAGTVVVLAEDTQVAVDEDLVTREALVLREAVLRFRRDTGWYPGEGPFDLAESASGTPRHPLARVSLARVQAEGVPPGEEARWFDSAANVWQLVEPPLAPADHPLASWDPDRGRGWHGPYLTLGTEGLVRVPFVSSRTGLGGADLVRLAPAIADPFQAVCPQGPTAADQPGYWVTPGGRPCARQGRPLLLFLPRDGSGRVLAGSPDARVVSTGADGLLSTADDAVVYLLR